MLEITENTLFNALAQLTKISNVNKNVTQQQSQKVEPEKTGKHRFFGEVQDWVMQNSALQGLVRLKASFIYENLQIPEHGRNNEEYHLEDLDDNFIEEDLELDEDSFE